MRRRLTALAVAAACLVPGTLAALPVPVELSFGALDEPGVVADVAVRGAQWDPDASCDLATVGALSSRHPAVRQFVVLATPSFGSTTGMAFVAVRSADDVWHCQTSTVAARYGRNGTRPLLDRRSGDGTTPAGVFALGETTAWDGQRVNVFGNRPDPGVRAGIGYRSVSREDCWGAIPGDRNYNHLVNLPGCAGPDNEWLSRFGDVYAHAAVIGANMNPISGDSPAEADRAYAAAIFLHRHSYTWNGTTRPTSGCVSVAYDQLVEIVTRLDPTLDPHFAIGPTFWLRDTA